MRQLSISVIAIFIAFFVSSCGNGGFGVVNPTPTVAPTITANPGSITVAVGSKATFTVSASGTGPLTYQWYKVDVSSNVSAISGATAASYQTANTVNGDNNNRYYAAVSNAAGNAVSGAATLTVLSGIAANQPPTIVSQPISATVIEGNAAAFTVLATGLNPLTYQWQLSINGGGAYNDIAAATAATYNTNITTLSQNNHRYRVIITAGNAQSTTSSGVILTVNGSLTVVTVPVVTTHPASTTVNAGTTASFSVVATGSDLVYQWQSRADTGAAWANIAGANASSYTTPVTVAVDAGKQFRAVVTNSAGSAASNAATLTVTAPPVITTQPTSQTVTVGNAVTFDVVASGSGNSYQWLRYNTGTWEPIGGATSSSYSFTPVIGDNGALFAVLVTNVAGSMLSNSATLTVNPLTTYTVTYNGNSNSGGTVPSNQTKTDGVNLTLASNSGTLVRTGYTFAGWNTAANGSGTDYAVGATYTANASATLYAKWTEVTTFSITGSVADGGTATAGVSVRLETAAGTLISTTTTNGSGNFSFTGLTGDVDDYQVVVEGTP